MKTAKVRIVTLAIFTALVSAAIAQATSFTYQGRLTDGPNAATGTYDLRFTLFEAAVEGDVLGEPVTNAPVVVTNGLFTVSLQFESSIFNGGGERWLEIAVRTNGSVADFVPLSPLQQITAAPYAIVAANLSGTLPSQNLEGTYFNPVNFNNAANNFSGNFAGWGGSLDGVNAVSLGGVAASDFWQLGGNAGTSPGTDFIGTSDDKALEFKVNGVRALRLEPNIFGQANVILGPTNNQISPFVFGSTISGGSGHTNQGILSTIGGGAENRIQQNARWTTIVGGVRNLIDSEANYSIVGAGVENSIQTNAQFGVIGGGRENAIQTNAHYNTIGGGQFNVVQANASSSTIGGGFGNQITAGSVEATIPGGGLNRAAASYAFAAGRLAQALHPGAFVWADSSGTQFSSTGLNEFAVRAGGGVRFDTGGAGMTLDNQPVLSGTVGTAQLADGSTLGEIADDDGSGSGLDADLLDGFNSTDFAVAAHDHDSAYWKLTGNSGPGVLGTTDNHPLEFHANGLRVLRLEPHATSPNVIGGAGANAVSAGVAGATIGGGGDSGLNNRVTDSYGTVAGGQGNRAGDGLGTASDRTGATVGGGLLNTATGAEATIAGGRLNQANASGAAIGGGTGNVVSSAYGTIPGGIFARSSRYGQMSYASGGFVVEGDAQTSVHVSRQITADATARELFLDGVSSRLTINSGRSMCFDILIVARSSGGQSAAYRVHGLIENVAGTTTLVPPPSPVVEVLGEDDAAWDVSVQADNANDALVIIATGNTGDIIRWVATVRSVEVSW